MILVCFCAYEINDFVFVLIDCILYATAKDNTMCIACLSVVECMLSLPFQYGLDMPQIMTHNANVLQHVDCNVQFMKHITHAHAAAMCMTCLVALDAKCYSMVHDVCACAAACKLFLILAAANSLTDDVVSAQWLNRQSSPK